MTRKFLSRFLRVFSVLLIFIAVAALLLSVLLEDLDYYTRQGLQYFENETGYRVTFDDIALHVGPRPGLRIEGFTFVETDSGRELLRGDNLYVRIKLRHLLQKRITIHQLLIEEPHIRVYRNADATWHSFISALAASELDESGGVFGEYRVSLLGLSLVNGTLEIRDALHDSSVRLHSCDISLHRDENNMFQMQMDAQHHVDGSRGDISATASFHRSLFNRWGPSRRLQTILTATLDFDKLPVRECLWYLPENLVVPVEGGLLDGSIEFELKQNRRMLADGSLVLKDARLASEGMEPVSLPETLFGFKAAVEQNAIDFTEFSLQALPDVQVLGTANVADMHTPDPKLTVQIHSGTVNAGAIASRLTVDDPQRYAWLGQASGRMLDGTLMIRVLDFSTPLGRTLRLDTVSAKADLDLAGLGCNVSSSLQLSVQDNSTASFVLDRGHVRGKGRVCLLPEDNHVFHIALDLAGKEPRGQCTITSRLIPASVNALFDGVSDKSAQGRAVMHDGTITLRTKIEIGEKLQVASEVDATDAAYTLAGIIGKPQGVSNTIRVNYVGGQQETVLPFVFRLGSALSTSGRLRYGDGFAAEGHFAAKDCSLESFTFPFLPPSLFLNGSVSGAGNFVVPAKENLHPFAGRLQLDGITLSKQTGVRPLMQVDALIDVPSRSEDISVSGGHIVAGETRGAFAGTLSSAWPPVGTFAAPMDFYDIGGFVNIMLDIVRSAKKKTVAPKPQSDASPSLFAKMDLNVALTSRQTKYLDWDFGPGSSDFSIRDKKMLWDAVDIEGGNGTVNGSVLYDLSNPDHYRLEFVIDRTDVDTTWAIPAFREKETITGRLDLKSRFSSNFKTGRQLLENMEGTFDFVVKDGKIKQMTLLSNILNMLNVAQLLVFKMPEFSSDGMPFETMTGRFLLNNKVLTTDDLLLQCPSMNFSAVGSLDLARRELDLLIGVQIFRTVAKALGSVPYFGRKLTGEGKTLTFTYFKARGSFEKPTILPIPSRAVDNAILKLFKSVREVPGDFIDFSRGMLRLFEGRGADNETVQ